MSTGHTSRTGRAARSGLAGGGGGVAALAGGAALSTGLPNGDFKIIVFEGGKKFCAGRAEGLAGARGAATGQLSIA